MSNAQNSKMRRLPRAQMDVLLQEQRLIALLFHRNKNQHRVARWWSQLSALKRAVRDVVDALQHMNGRNLNMLYHTTTKFVRTQVRRMYTQFNEVIALCQFPTLGVVLVATLSRVFRLVTEVREFYAEEFAKFKQIQKPSAGKRETHVDGAVAETVLPVGDEEIGEVITESSLQSAVPTPTPSEKELSLDIAPVRTEKKLPLDIPPIAPDFDVTPTSHKKSKGGKKPKDKKRKKKSKSAIDSIFG
ncbi:Rmp1 protein [Maudiozyma humilis]|uniref:Rmp1 protein n=1 Tax=Maudiozyma humilis TaxID=51915 RepID=A0AAV5S5X5_MAUHU|nr:Rmp1 protein [Kazachstania humilis]